MNTYYFTLDKLNYIYFDDDDYIPDGVWIYCLKTNKEYTYESLKEIYNSYEEDEKFLIDISEGSEVYKSEIPLIWGPDVWAQDNNYDEYNPAELWYLCEDCVD